MNDHSIIEDWNNYIKDRPTVNMNSCVKGQKLLTRLGKIVTYDEKLDCTYYPYYPHKIIYWDGAKGTRTDEGWVFRENPSPLDDDIIYIFPTHSKIE